MLLSSVRFKRVLDVSLPQDHSAIVQQCSVLLHGTFRITGNSSAFPAAAARDCMRGLRVLLKIVRVTQKFKPQAEILPEAHEIGYRNTIEPSAAGGQIKEKAR
jgi:hypothetical protein